jgi:hypothetical protein
VSDVRSEQERVADELRRLRDEVRERALHERAPGDVLPAPAPLRIMDAAPPEAQPPGRAPIVRPDPAALRAALATGPGPPASGLRGWLAGRLQRALRPVLDAQAAFNAQQASLDDALLEYIDARFAETHRHYDSVLGIHGRHMEDIDKRHLILQEELVAHVHDLVKRIDLVLSESERGRLSLEFALRDLRERLARLEERLARG